MPYVVGLTGGIGSGKSTVAELFEKLGADVVDTDQISRGLTQAGGRAIEPIRQQFGERFIASDGGLDRAAMRSLVFSDPNSKSKLEGILHPLIGAEVTRLVAVSRGPYVVLVVPLLIETEAYRDVLNRVLVVDCDEAKQVSRVMARSGLRRNEVEAIMASQVRRSQRLQRADDVVTNDGPVEGLVGQVAALDKRYREFAQAR